MKFWRMLTGHVPRGKHCNKAEMGMFAARGICFPICMNWKVCTLANNNKSFLQTRLSACITFWMPRAFMSNYQICVARCKVYLLELLIVMWICDTNTSKLWRMVPSNCRADLNGRD